MQTKITSCYNEKCVLDFGLSIGIFHKMTKTHQPDFFAGEQRPEYCFSKTLYIYIYNWKLRRIKESMLINSLNPSAEIDASKLLSPEKGLEIAECWKECNHMVRDMLKKATSKNTPKPPKRTQKQKSPRGKKK